MRLFRLAILLSFMLSWPIVITAQTVSDRNWDNLLDRYESIGRQCIELKKQSDDGTAIPAATLTQLMEQLNSLKTELQSGSSKMSEAQKLRFERIRAGYLNGLSANESIPEIPTDNAWITDTVPDVHDVPDVPNTTKVTETTNADRQHFGITLLAGLSPMSGGIMLSTGHDSWSAYVKLRSSFLNLSTQYDCESSGRLQNGGMIWPNGHSTTVDNALTAGFAAQIAGPASLYAGAGYGRYTLAWQDIDGNWAKVCDKSSKGIAADAGMLISIGHLSLMAGISTICFTHLNAEIGVGITF